MGKFKTGLIAALSVFLILIIMAFILTGASPEKFRLTLSYGDEILLDKDYSVKFSTKLKIKILYGGDYYKFYDNADDKELALSQINADIGNDVTAIANAKEKPPSAPYVSWDGEKFTLTHGENGVLIDKSALIEEILKNYSENIRLELKKIEIPPDITEDELLSSTVKLSEFTTYYSSSAPERKHNLRLAASKIHGTILKPAESFSFNGTVGERTVKNGFKTATIIDKGEFTQGVGGGVCQTSTTLYNAALLAGLKIEKVRRHSLPISYVPLSFDAMVSSASDLIFYNPTDYNVYIAAKSDDSKLTFTIYGKNVNPDEKIVLRSQTVRVIPYGEYEHIYDDGALSEDENERVIKQPRNGYQSKGFIDVYKNGELTESREIRSDEYQPQKGKKIIRREYAEISG